jgi:hypothetical protein
MAYRMTEPGGNSQTSPSETGPSTVEITPKFLGLHWPPNIHDLVG